MSPSLSALRMVRLRLFLGSSFFFSTLRLANNANNQFYAIGNAVKARYVQRLCLVFDKDKPDAQGMYSATIVAALGANSQALNVTLFDPVKKSAKRSSLNSILYTKNEMYLLQTNRAGYIEGLLSTVGKQKTFEKDKRFQQWSAYAWQSSQRSPSLSLIPNCFH